MSLYFSYKSPPQPLGMSCNSSPEFLRRRGGGMVGEETSPRVADSSLKAVVHMNLSEILGSLKRD